MTKKEIFEAEQTNYDKVVCYKEGAFWVSYEHSAYLFCKYIRPFRPSKKMIQAVGHEVISIGFPDQGWVQLNPMVVFVEKNQNRVVLQVHPKETSLDEFIHNFDAWKDGIQAFISLKKRSTTIHENLPVYKSAYDLTIKIFQQSQHMKKEYRYTLGERLKNEVIDLLIDIYSANTLEDKLPYINDARRRIELIRLMLRVLRDTGQIAVRNAASMNLDIEEISKQLAAWHATTIKRMGKM